MPTRGRKKKKFLSFRDNTEEINFFSIWFRLNSLISFPNFYPGFLWWVVEQNSRKRGSIFGYNVSLTSVWATVLVHRGTCKSPSSIWFLNSLWCLELVKKAYLSLPLLKNIIYWYLKCPGSLKTKYRSKKTGNCSLNSYSSPLRALLYNHAHK